MTAILKTVVVLSGPTGPTGTIKGVHILSAFTGASGGHANWLQATGPTGVHGQLERVYNVTDGAGRTGAHKTVIISGFVGATGS